MGVEAGPMERAFRAEMGIGGLTGVENDPEQLDLLRDDDGKLPANVFRMMRDPKRGPGRPAGSGNRKFDDLAKLIVTKHGDPVQFMASVYAMPLDIGVELLLAAEGVPERNQEIEMLCQKAGNLIDTGIAQGWGAEKMKVVARTVESLERAASALKSKPGDIALKFVGHQLAAAKEVAGYVHSKKPTESNVNLKNDFSAVVLGATPGDAVATNLIEAINNGTLQERDLVNIRVIEGDFSIVDPGDDT